MSKPRDKVRHFISSLDLSARQFDDVILNNWSVEIIDNQLDVSHGEDKREVNRGVAAEVLSAFKKLARDIINLMNGKCRSMPVPRVPRLLSRGPECLTRILANPVGKAAGPLGWLTRRARGAEATPAGNPGLAVAVGQ